MRCRADRYDMSLSAPKEMGISENRAEDIPWTSSCFDDCSISKDYRQINDPILHRTISDCIRSTFRRKYPSVYRYNFDGRGG